MNGLIVRMNGSSYVIDAKPVRTLERHVSLDRRAAWPPYVRGLVNTEETWMPVIDVGFVLYGTKTDETASAYIVYDTTLWPVILLVERVERLVVIDPSELATKSMQLFSQVPYLPAAYRTEETLLPVIDVSSFVRSLDGIEEVIETIRRFIQREEERKERARRPREEERALEEQRKESEQS